MGCERISSILEEYSRTVSTGSIWVFVVPRIDFLLQQSLSDEYRSSTCGMQAMFAYSSPIDVLISHLSVEVHLHIIDRKAITLFELFVKTTVTMVVHYGISFSNIQVCNFHLFKSKFTTLPTRENTNGAIIH